MATLSKQMAVAIAPKFTAASSAFGSLLIVLFIHRERRRQTVMENRNKVFPTYFRLVFGMSVCDISASVAWFFTTWPIPQGTPGVYGKICNTYEYFLMLTASCQPNSLTMIASCGGQPKHLFGTRILCPVFSLYCHVQCKPRYLLCFGRC